MTVPELTLIILNYNGRNWLHQTLTTLHQFYLTKTETKVTTIVVDNQSTDDSVAMVKKEFSWVKLMVLPHNVGFAAGNNAALKTVTSPYVMLLNSDLEFTTQSNLDDLIFYLDQHPEVGMITPKLLLNNGQLDLAAHRGEPTPWAALTYFAKLEKYFPKFKLLSQYHQTYKGFTSIHQIDACSGAAMMVRTSAINKIGLLDEQFFMYAEDLDWCRRFRQSGFKIVFYPKVAIIHHKNKSGRKSVEKKTAATTNHYFYDTMLQYYDKYYATHYPKIVRIVLQKILNYHQKES